jgi:hypothetical protein
VRDAERVCPDTPRLGCRGGRRALRRVVLAFLVRNREAEVEYAPSLTALAGVLLMVRRPPRRRRRVPCGRWDQAPRSNAFLTVSRDLAVAIVNLDLQTGQLAAPPCRCWRRSRPSGAWWWWWRSSWSRGCTASAT